MDCVSVAFSPTRKKLRFAPVRSAFSFFFFICDAPPYVTTTASVMPRRGARRLKSMLPAPELNCLKEQEYPLLLFISNRELRKWLYNYTHLAKASKAQAHCCLSRLTVLSIHHVFSIWSPFQLQGRRTYVIEWVMPSIYASSIPRKSGRAKLYYYVWSPSPNRSFSASSPDLRRLARY